MAAVSRHKIKYHSGVGMYRCECGVPTGFETYEDAYEHVQRMALREEQSAALDETDLVVQLAGWEQRIRADERARCASYLTGYAGTMKKNNDHVDGAAVQGWADMIREWR